jgi:hypothetical protein
MSLPAEPSAPDSPADGPRRRGGGPQTPEGRARSCQNALRHGLCAAVLALPDEDPNEAENLFQELRAWYRFRGPVARDLALAYVRAVLRSRRADAALDVSAHDRVAVAIRPFDDPDAVLAEAQLRFRHDPAAGRALLVQTVAGRRWLADRWRPLAAALGAGHWSWVTTREALRLLGHDPRDRAPAADPRAWELGLLGAVLEGTDPETIAEDYYGPGRAPAALPAGLDPESLPTPESARARLGGVIAAEVAEQHAAAAALAAADDAAARRRAAARAYLPDDSPDARLHLRYAAEARSQVLRLGKALEAAVDRERRGLDPGSDETEPAAPAPAALAPEPAPPAPAPAPVPPPNDLKPAAAVSPKEAEPAPVTSPNELKPAPSRNELTPRPRWSSPDPIAVARLAALTGRDVTDRPVGVSSVPISITGRPPLTPSR